MPRMVSRIVRWMSSSACVVTSPMTIHSPFVMAVSHATRASASWLSIPSRTASETWSQTLSGWPSVTDSEVSRYEGDVLNELATTAVNDIGVGRLGRAAPIRGRSRAVALAPILRGLAEQLSLHRKYVVEDAIDAPSFQPMLGDHSRMLQLAPKGCPQRPIDASLTAHLGFLEQLQATVEGKLPQFVLANAHVPSTSTLPAVATRMLTWLS